MRVFLAGVAFTLLLEAGGGGYWYWSNVRESPEEAAKKRENSPPDERTEEGRRELAQQDAEIAELTRQLAEAKAVASAANPDPPDKAPAGIEEAGVRAPAPTEGAEAPPPTPTPATSAGESGATPGPAPAAAASPPSPPPPPAGVESALSEALRTRDYARLVPWLRDGTITQIRRPDPRVAEPRKMAENAPSPIKAIALVHSPPQTAYECAFNMAEWPSYVPRVKRAGVKTVPGRANFIKVDMELALPFVGNSRSQEEYTGDPGASVIGVVLAGDYDGWHTWRFHAVGDGSWCVVEHESRVVMKNFIVRAFVTDKQMEAAINQSAVSIRLDAIKTRAESIARKARATASAASVAGAGAGGKPGDGEGRAPAAPGTEPAVQPAPTGGHAADPRGAAGSGSGAGGGERDF